MKALISILILLGVIFTVFKLFNYWEKVGQQREAEQRAEQRRQSLDPRSLPGLPPQMEQGLAKIYEEGPRALKEWIMEQKRTKKVEDPRLAWIELDYVVLASEDPVDAKKVFAEVKKRTPPDSPVYPRIKQLEKTYE